MSKSNVIPLPARREPPQEEAVAPKLPDLRRFPVDVRGNVTFTRLVEGLATVGLTVRIDARSHRVVITDDEWE